MPALSPSLLVGLLQAEVPASEEVLGKGEAGDVRKLDS